MFFYVSTLRILNDTNRRKSLVGTREIGRSEGQEREENPPPPNWKANGRLCGTQTDAIMYWTVPGNTRNCRWLRVYSRGGSLATRALCVSLFIVASLCAGCGKWNRSSVTDCSTLGIYCSLILVVGCLYRQCDNNCLGCNNYYYNLKSHGRCNNVSHMN